MKNLILITIMLFQPIWLISQQLQPSQQAVSIPVGGNTFITTRDIVPPRTRNSGTELIRNNGIERWINPDMIYSTYFRVSKTGNMSLFVRYSASDDSEVKATVGNNSFNVNLPKGDAQLVFIGSVMQADTGYVRLDLQGVRRVGDEFARVSTIIVDGEVTGAPMSFVDNDFSFHFGRRGPSVHLNFPFPEGEEIEWFYSEVTVPQGEDQIGTFYMTNGFGEGYFGIQVNSPTERRILFSVWSPYHTDNPNEIPEDQRITMVKRGENVHTGEFGNEGSGGQSFLRYMWITGNTYKFLNRVRPLGNGSTEYTAYFFAPEIGKWRLIAQFIRPKTDTWYKRAHSFLESFNPELGYIGRKGFYNNQWARTVDGRWFELTTARFTADETARRRMRMDYKGGVENGQFFMQNCGFLNDFTAMGSFFTRPATGIEPVIDWEQLE